MSFIVSTFATMKPYRRKLPISVITLLICSFAFMTLLYTQRIGYLSSNSVFKFNYSCSTKVSSVKSNNKQTEEKTEYPEYMDDRFDFDPEECNVMNGKWVFNTSIKPLYTEKTCPYLDRQISCVANGRPDSDYLHWEWQLEDCILPRFNPLMALKKLRNKRVLFVGDSLQRGQWESFLCMLQSVIPHDQKSMKRGRSHSVFKATEYNASIEFYWAPFLVESNSDNPIIGDAKKRILKVDSVAKHAQHWVGVDFLIFNSYVWWTNGLKIKSLWGSFANGEEGFEELDLVLAYKIGLKTWANWVDSNVDPNKTRVFFTTMSPTHFRNEDWGNNEGIKCYNETKPVMKKNHWGTGSNKNIMKVVVDIINKMKFPVTLLNITQISEYRIDGHTSVYTETGGKLLTKEEQADPKRNADCIHWCLPGIPDTWNQIFFAHL